MSSTALRHHLFNVEEFHRMGETGIFQKDDRVELVEGEIIEMAPIGSRHASCVAGLVELFGAYQGDALMWVQNPISLDYENEPQPDFALLKPRDDRYANHLPTPKDIFLVVEVAETSFSYDREFKAPLYAKSGIPELWIVDLPEQLLEIHTRPGPEGYEIIRRCSKNEVIRPTALTSYDIALKELFRG